MTLAFSIPSARWLAWLGCLALLLGGCTQPQQPPQKPNVARQTPVTATPGQPGPVGSTDPCATRLHDISGALLLFYLQHGDLPETLADLPALPGGGQVAAFTCPESGRPYLYNPEGLARDAHGALVILADPEPTHAGMHWGISIVEPRPGQPLITRVIAIPRFAPPAAASGR